MIGGLEGIQRMKNNADVLIAFAVFLQNAGTSTKERSWLRGCAGMVSLFAVL